MVDLPQVPRRLVVSQQPQTTVGQREIAGPGLAMQEGLQSLGTGLETALEPVAKEAGAAAVQRGPDGQLSVNRAFPIFGRLGNVFADSAKAAFDAQSDSSMNVDLQAHRNKLFLPEDQGGFGGNMDSWRKAGEAYVSQRAGSYRGGDQLYVKQQGTRLLDQYSVSGMNEKLNLDTASQKTAIASQIGTKTNEITALAREGGTDTDAYRSAVGDVRKLYSSLSANPLFGYPKEKVDAELVNLEAHAKGQAIVGAVERTYKTEGFDTAEKQAKQLLTEKTLNEGERQQYFNLAMGQIRLQESERRAVIAGINQEVSQHESNILTNPNYDKASIDGFKDRAARSGAVEAWNRVLIAQQRRDIMNTVSQFPAEQRAALAAGAPMVGMFDRLSSAMQGVESSNNPLAVSQKGATGLMQVIPSTARGIAQQMGDRNFPVNGTDEQVQAYLKDPKVGKAYGNAYLAQQLRDFNGDVEAALVAYNAGPQRAKDWIAGGRDSTTLPQETQDYVRKVTDAYSRGASPLPPAGQRLTADNWNLQFYQPRDMLAKTDAGAWVDARAAKAADLLGQSFFQQTGVRIAINSGQEGTVGNRRGTRDPNDNPGADHSKHIEGQAFDFQIQDLSPAQKAQFLTMARQAGFGGVGFYEGKEGHIHLDMGPPRQWGAVPDWAKEAMSTPVAGGSMAYTGVGNRRAQAIQGAQAGQAANLMAIQAGQASPMTDPWLQGQLRTMAQADFNDMFPKVQNAINQLQVPSKEQVNTLGMLAVQLGDQKKIQQVAELGARAEIGQDFQTMTEAERQSAIAAKAQEYRAGAETDKLEQLNWVKSLHDRIAQGMKDDPWGTAASMNHPVPSASINLDFSNPQALASGLAQRAKDGYFLAQHEGLAAVPAFRPNEIDRAKDLLRNGTPDQVTAMMGAMSALPEDMRLATLSKLVEKGDVDPYVQAIQIYKDAPQISRSIISGMRLINDERYAPKADVFAEAFYKALPPGQFGSDGNGNSNSRQLESVRNAVLARVTDVTFQTGESGKNVSETAIQKAINDVTGGVVSYNGAKVVVPKYGMGDGEFGKTMAALRPEDVRGAVSLNGTPLKPADLMGPSAGIGPLMDKLNPWQPAYRLQAAGDGKYLVYTDVGGARRYVMQMGTLTSANAPGANPSPRQAELIGDKDRGAGGSPFILDLKPAADRARRPWLEQQSMMDDASRAGMGMPGGVAADLGAR